MRLFFICELLSGKTHHIQQMTKTRKKLSKESFDENEQRRVSGNVAALPEEVD